METAKLTPSLPPIPITTRVPDVHPDTQRTIAGTATGALKGKQLKRIKTTVISNRAVQIPTLTFLVLTELRKSRFLLGVPSKRCFSGVLDLSDKSEKQNRLREKPLAERKKKKSRWIRPE